MPPRVRVGRGNGHRRRREPCSARGIAASAAVAAIGPRGDGAAVATVAALASGAARTAYRVDDGVRTATAAPATVTALAAPATRLPATTMTTLMAGTGDGAVMRKRGRGQRHRSGVADRPAVCVAAL